VVVSTAVPAISVVDVTEYVPAQMFFGTLNGNETALEVPFGIVKGGVININDLEVEQETGPPGPVKSNSILTV